MGWLSGWSYRKSHIIQPSVGAGTLYQKQIRVHKTTSRILTRTSKADMTYARMFSQQGVINGKIYVVGGRNFGVSRFNYNEEYDPATNTWATKTPYPITEDAASCGVLVDADSVTRFHVVCGYPDDSAVHKHYGYDPIDNDWTEYAAGPLAMWDGGGVVINNKFYIFGGSTDGNCKNTIYEYNPATNAWVQKTSMTYARAMFAFSVHNGKIYVFTGSWAVPTLTCEVYDPVANSWTTLNDAPMALGHASKESINGKIYLHTWADSTLMYEYDPVTDTYNPMTIPSYTPILFLSLECVVIGTKFYAIGGQTASDVTKTCYELEVTTTTTDGAEKVHLGGNCRDDFGDVRFTDNDGDTLLDCWMESKVDSNYAIFWVEVADSLETDPATIYVYYGKADATTTSNGPNTFIWFDDFEGTTPLNNYTCLAGTPSEFDIYDVGGTHAKVFRKNTSAGAYWLWVKNALTIQNCAIIVDIYPNSVTNNYQWVSPRVVDSLNWYYGGYFKDGGGIFAILRKRVAGSDTLLANTAISVIDKVWHKWEFAISGSSLKLYLDDALKPSATDSTFPNAGPFGMSGYYYECYYDNLRVRKYVSPEPAHGTWGSEETPAVAHTLTVTEYLGGLDSYSRTKSIYRTITESLGVLDSKSRIKSYFRTITEAIGALDTKSRSKGIHRTITELLGLKDTRSRVKSINRTITELLGLKDVRWLPSIPPMPPVITAAVGKIKRVLLDKFLGWLEQPAEDNPRVRCDVEVSWMQTNRITRNINTLFTETVRIKGKVAYVFTETMPITSAILHEYTETVQIRSGIIQKFEETVHITGDLMKAVIEDGFKVFGEVIPLREYLHELRRKVEEN